MGSDAAGAPCDAQESRPSVEGRVTERWGATVDTDYLSALWGVPLGTKVWSVEVFQYGLGMAPSARRFSGVYALCRMKQIRL